MGLSPGDYLEVELEDVHLILTPEMLIEKRLAEGLEDIKQGRVEGPFNTARKLEKSWKILKKILKKACVNGIRVNQREV